MSRGPFLRLSPITSSKSSLLRTSRPHRGRNRHRCGRRRPRSSRYLISSTCMDFSAIRGSLASVGSATRRWLCATSKICCGFLTTFCPVGPKRTTWPPLARRQAGSNQHLHSSRHRCIPHTLQRIRDRSGSPRETCRCCSTQHPLVPGPLSLAELLRATMISQCTASIRLQARPGTWIPMRGMCGTKATMMRWGYQWASSMRRTVFFSIAASARAAGSMSRSGTIRMRWPRCCSIETHTASRATTTMSSRYLESSAAPVARGWRGCLWPILITPSLHLHANISSSIRTDLLATRAATDHRQCGRDPRCRERSHISRHRHRGAHRVFSRSTGSPRISSD
eukprot:comp20599_c0_seq1/m.41915 comp20599_c0_seq1/g.41915  ORF comp20599_c0_seq1/g.41915 comp20599_c0_seq1/m.41915 type:complete len:338 (+) comp20599_c0_seq1:75-1088(+)